MRIDEVPAALLGDRLRLLGEAEMGGYGAVFTAEDRLLERRVAVKVLRGAFRDEEALTRFRQEADAVARLRHPHLLQVLDVTTDGDAWVAIVVEFVHGRSLQRRIDEHDVGETRAVCQWGLRIAQALAALHLSGQLHRDVTPANILIRERDGWPLLADRGLLRSTDLARTRTLTGDVVGSPTYLAPEAWLQAPASPAEDQFSLGAVLFRALYQESVYGSDEVTDILELVQGGWVPEIPPLKQGRFPGLEAIVLRMCAPDPADRYADLELVAQDLWRALQEGSAALGHQDHRHATWFQTLETTSRSVLEEGLASDAQEHHALGPTEPAPTAPRIHAPVAAPTPPREPAGGRALPAVGLGLLVLAVTVAGLMGPWGPAGGPSSADASRARRGAWEALQAALPLPDPGAPASDEVALDERLRAYLAALTAFARVATPEGAEAARAEVAEVAAVARTLRGTEDPATAGDLAAKTRRQARLPLLAARAEQLRQALAAWSSGWEPGGAPPTTLEAWSLLRLGDVSDLPVDPSALEAALEALEGSGDDDLRVQAAPSALGLLTRETPCPLRVRVEAFAVAALAEASPPEVDAGLPEAVLGALALGGCPADPARAEALVDRALAGLGPDPRAGLPRARAWTLERLAEAMGRREGMAPAAARVEDALGGAPR